MDQQEEESSSTTNLEEHHPTTSARRRSNKPTLANAASSFIASTRQTVQSVVMNLRGGRRKSNNGGTGKTTSKVKAALPGETEFDTLLNIAEYEVKQDPYRGLMSHEHSLETGLPITTPWNACEWGSLPPDQTLKEDLCPQTIVRHVGHCACPSLKAWTRQLQITSATKKSSTKKSKKRKLNDTTMTTDPIFAVGLRPTDVHYRCSCDYNPLCLGSLGGVVTEIITERYQDMEIPSSESSEAKASPPPPPPPPPPPTESPPKVAREGEEKGMIEAIPSQKSTVKEESTSSTNKETSSNKENNKAEIIIDLEAEKIDETSPSAGEKKKEDFSKEENGGLDAFTFLGADETAQSFPEEKSVVQSKPLEKNKLIELPEGNPAEIYTAEDQTQQYLTDIQYTPSTTDELKRLRRTLDMDTSKIRSYVYRTLRIQHHSAAGEADGLTLDKFMETLRQWHNSLLFVNPVDEERRLPSDRMTLSLPPGIQNLGATCYLNTQLQCLAQNTAFLNGIFSWRMVNTSHNMNSVMTKLQSLLAQMVLGGDCKLTTLDFSNALGLEHDEQQDPNEFARLLFERMDESFQQCDNDGDLANLLQRIFHGVTTYETICMTCGHSSERSEGFMDLNLPIIKRPKEKATTIEALFAKNVDTDVQYCLDQYTCAELLEGDNQYLCSTCDCKRDAKRVLKLTELPPVLNVQLSRYVFDRAKFVKKKLTDKVLLPTTLHVERSGGLKKKYLLCAVMRHQGTSAYSGHYVAEAMDWLTGQWFEFNDETVKVLPEGPSCSYDPDADDSEKQDDKSEEKEKKPSTSSGSQDAYNMYYVDEDFLSKNAAAAMLRRSRLCLADKIEGKIEGNSVLGDVTSKREAKYAILSGMCFADGRKSDRLRRRKTGIRKFMMQNAGSLIHDKTGSVPKGKDESTVWVETDFLERFLRCDRHLDQYLQSSGTLLRHQRLLCDHNRLHPRVTRRGKLLPRSMYNAYISLLEGERTLLNQESEAMEEGNRIANDCIITPASNLFCSKCSQSYRDELSKKLESLKNVKNLYDALNSLTDDSALFYEEGEDPASAEEAYTYAVSRQTVTKYRKCVAALMKTLAKFDDGGTVDAEDSSFSKQTIYEGLDALDISPFQFDQAEGDARMNKTPEQVDSRKENESIKLDRLFNSNITCPHGNCNVLNNGRVIRFIPWNVWLMVKKVFSDAVEHKRKKVAKNDATDLLDPDEEGCPICQAQKASIDKLRTDLESWAKETRGNHDLKALLDGNRTVSREIEVHNFTNAKTGCRLVHRSDIQTWRETVNTLLGAGKVTADDSTGLKRFVENIAFPSYHRVVLEFERQPVERLVTSLRSLICREHRLVIKSAIFRDVASLDTDKKEDHRLSDCIAVLPDEEYHAYITSLAELLRILHPDSDNNDLGTMGSPVVIDGDKAVLREIRKITGSYHPAIRMCVDGKEMSCDDILYFSLDGSSKEFLLSPGVCSCETCMKEFSPLMAQPNNGDDDKVENISVDSFDSKRESAKKQPKLGSIAADPILVESDLEDSRPSAPNTVSLRTFQVKQNVSLDDALDSLKTVSALPSDFDSNEVSSLRRSSRKRKSRYPCGSLLGEDAVRVGLHHNMAALRLLLYETCEIPLSGRRLILVLSSSNNDEMAHKTLEISFDWGQRTLQELVHEMRGETEENIDSAFEPSKHLLLLYQKEENGDSRGLHETLMDSLLQVANLEAPDANEKSGSTNKRKNRPSERGFQGTLLQSSSAQNHNENGEDAKSKCEKSILDVSAISDEEKDSEPPIVESAKKQAILSDSSDDDDLLHKSPFAPKKQRGSQFDMVKVATEAKIIIESDSSDNGEKKDCRAQTPISKNSEDVVPESPSDQDEVMSDTFTSPIAHLRNNVLSSLLVAVDQPADESTCWDAVNWAIDQNLAETSESALLDAALAKYLSSYDI